jgi:hypothetical protein
MPIEMQESTIIDVQPGPLRADENVSDQSLTYIFGNRTNETAKSQHTNKRNASHLTTLEVSNLSQGTSQDQFTHFSQRTNKEQ